MDLSYRYPSEMSWTNREYYEDESWTDDNKRMTTAELREFLKLDADVIKRLDMMCANQPTDDVPQPESSNMWGLLSRATQQSHPTVVQLQ